MPEPLPEFSFLGHLEGDYGAITDMSIDELREAGEWTPTAESRVLRLVSEGTAVLVAAKSTSVSLLHRTELSGDWIVVSPRGHRAIDAVGVAGPVRVRIEVSANLLECPEHPTGGTSSAPFIELRGQTVVRDFVGACRLGKLDGQLNCKRGSRRERPAKVYSVGEQSRGKLEGVDVTQLPSRPNFDYVAKLSVFAPDVESLYDLACPYDRIASRLRQWRRREFFDPSEDSLSTPRERAHWFRDLYNAMGSNAVPASTRAAVRWCYALLEHESIKPRRTPLRGTGARWLRHLVGREALESLGRWLYRCVGYGQRPARALACWLIATAGVTFWSVQRSVVEGGAAGWLQRAIEVLLSPLGALRLGSGGTTGPLDSAALDPIAYLLVGLPFLFFVVSLREFFRSPLNRRSPTP